MQKYDVVVDVRRFFEPGFGKKADNSTIADHDESLCDDVNI